MALFRWLLNDEEDTRELAKQADTIGGLINEIVERHRGAENN